MKNKKLQNGLLVFLSFLMPCAVVTGASLIKTGGTAEAAAVPEVKYENTVLEDAYIRNGSNASKNYNYENITQAHGQQYVGKNYKVINVKYNGSNEIMSVMKFDLPTAEQIESGGIDTVYLQFSLFKNADYNNGDQSYVFSYTSDTDWSENSVTWNNRPSSVVRNSEDKLFTFDIKKGDEYEFKEDGEKIIKKDITQTAKKLASEGINKITVFAYAEKSLETSILIHSKETADVNKRARIIGVKENIDMELLKNLVADMSDISQENYTPASYAPFKSAYDFAVSVCGNVNADRADIIKAYRQLESAYAGLKTSNTEDNRDNIAYGKPVHSNLNRAAAENITDGEASTYWEGVFYPSYADIDLGDDYNVNKAVIVVPKNKRVYFSLYASTDGKDYTKIYELREFKNVSSGEHTVIFSKPVDMRILRVYMEYTQNEDKAYISEVKVYGQYAGGNSGVLRAGSLEDILGVKAYSETDYAKPITQEETIENVYGIIDRTIGSKYRSWFSFALEASSGKDFYTIRDKNGKIHITGNTGLSLTTGLNYYYKHYLNVNISEQTMQVKMPSAIVPVGGIVKKETEFSVRYAYNYCTLSYTFAFFDAEAWQRENDWLALNGVNVVMDLAGQEATWIKFLMNYGYSFDDAKDWLTGPSYYAWQFMDNMESFGGPVPDGYVKDRVELARSSQRWKNSLGMQTILQGYAGMVPTNFTEFNPAVSVIEQGGWNGFTRPSMIATDSALYDELAEAFYEAQEFVYGKNNHYYAVDPFHEGGKRPSGLSDSTIAENVLESLLKYDKDGVWVVQGWQSNPTNGLLEGMGAYRNTNVLIVDLIKYPLQSNTKYNVTKYGSTTLKSKEFNGTDWVWGLLGSFGGNPSMHGQLQVMAKDILNAKKTSSHMKGIGIISEAQYDNPVVYDLIFDLAWADEDFVLDSWLKDYIIRRYGGTSASARRAWEILRDTNYSHGVRFTNEVYGMKNKGPQGYSAQTIAYGAQNLEQALRYLLEDFELFKDSEGYRYDLTELMRQVVSNYSVLVYNDILAAVSKKDAASFAENKVKFLKSLEVLNAVQATQKNQLAGEWIGRAQDLAADYDDFAKDAFEMNAKALITSWGSRSSNRSLKDYGWRNYEGMFTDLYANIWKEYLGNVENALINGGNVATKSINDYFDVYWQWNLGEQNYIREAKDTPEDLFAAAMLVLEHCVLSGELDENAGNAALNRTVTSNSCYIEGELSSAVDGKTDVCVKIDPVDRLNGKNNPSVTVDLVGEFELSKISISFGGEGCSYELYASADGSEWTKVRGGRTEAGLDINLNVTASARYVKLVNSGGTALELKELRVYGERLLPDLVQLKRLTDHCKSVTPEGEFEVIANYQAALQKAEKGLLSEAPPDEINSLYWALYDAFTAEGLSLKDNNVCDKSQLEAVVAQCKDIDLTVYTSASADLLKKAIMLAENVLSEESAVQEMADCAVEDIFEAMSLLKTPAEVEDSGGSMTGLYVGLGVGGAAVVGAGAVAAAVIIKKRKTNKEGNKDEK